MRRFILVGLIAIGVGAAPAQAVTNGTHDTAHSMVGVLAADLPGDPAGLQYVCSGTLIAPTAFLTAGHCVLDLGGVDASWVAVTFDDQITPEWDAFPPHVSAASWQPVGSYVFHPAYRQNAIDAYNDVGIVRLAEPVTSVGTAHVADEAGYLAGAVVKNERFAFVGYGVNAVLNRFWFTGPPNAVWDGFRTLAWATYGALTPYFLRLQTNAAVDPTLGTPGPGDSGAPVFANVDGQDVAVAVVSSGNSMMKNQRLDTEAVQAWLHEEVPALGAARSSER